jgi:hypothetical protein
MDVFSYKKVKIRAKRSCLSCQRSFEKGTLMFRNVTVDNGISSCYICLTCDELLSKHISNFTDDNIIYPGEIKESLEKGQTPEMLLKILNNDTKRKG